MLLNRKDVWGGGKCGFTVIHSVLMRELWPMNKRERCGTKMEAALIMKLFLRNVQKKNFPNPQHSYDHRIVVPPHQRQQRARCNRCIYANANKTFLRVISETQYTNMVSAVCVSSFIRTRWRICLGTLKHLHEAWRESRVLLTIIVCFFLKLCRFLLCDVSALKAVENQPVIKNKTTPSFVPHEPFDDKYPPSKKNQGNWSWSSYMFMFTLYFLTWFLSHNSLRPA